MIVGVKFRTLRRAYGRFAEAITSGKQGRALRSRCGEERVSELASEPVSQRLRPVTSAYGPTERSEGER